MTIQTCDITLVASAKLNLFLEIVGERADGYHLIDSLVAFLDIGDAVHLRRADALSLRLAGPYAAGVPDDGSNLAMRAVRLLESLAGRSLPVAMSIEKSIPVGAGLGGGSADAAAVLRGLVALYHLPIDAAALRHAALALGADVPACLMARPVHVSGIGEALSIAADCPSLPVVLVHPGVGLATPAVYKAYDTAHDAGHGDCACCRPARSFAPISYVDALAQRRNDLEHAAIGLAPEVGLVLAALAQVKGCQLARMSGSGSAAFGIFGDAAAAAAAAAAIARAHPAWWVRAARLDASPEATA